MTDETGVNTQITDSVTQAHVTMMNQSPMQSSAILDVVMAETVGMGMHNAINAQHSMQMMASAAITATCARMINGQEGLPQRAADPQDENDENKVTSTPPLAPQDPATIIAAAESEAQKAASTISKAAQMAKQTVSEAKTALTKLGTATNADSTDSDNKPNPGSN